MFCCPTGFLAWTQTQWRPEGSILLISFRLEMPTARLSSCSVKGNGVICLTQSRQLLEAKANPAPEVTAVEGLRGQPPCCTQATESPSATRRKLPYHFQALHSLETSETKQ